MKHRPVLLNETIEGLGLSEDSVVLDCTFGGGGHSKEILRRYRKAKVVAIDEDRNVEGGENISLYHENFRNLDRVLQKENIEKVDGVIFDLGFSSDQLESSGRGFSFLKDEPLLMTLKAKPGEEDLTAKMVINNWSEKSLADIIYGYGEERYARRIARIIAEERFRKPIETTGELVEIIKKAVPSRYRTKKIHFATRTFQALRIAVNDELGALKEGLEKGFEALKPESRMAVISFHSLEDRIVKKFYKEKASPVGLWPRVEESKAVLINKKPIRASDEEIKNNIRSRSAKLRIIKKIK
ncbi:16S rRNA (cytosine(1402)-N(4))-methyltransferase [Candidatus Nomurabacteria bacterium RIFCSPLOWO2_01_FULL_46_18]|uniref:Ribosomal RNA small subunit methyltransferase H n=1 Tax=Candidatus Nomurabacteria bacterium RIFCSPLOWO2_01_FULL_46_18 TaxID=1801783 RepID=A0A1F6XDX7_9BACT|nr:MAG: 16S rRNA (cytosine(1402)-N(4))-methyltransferase [Candidatus Nomurabacteria bacterium RIFCSPLOWO2_01_FULL_46_18]